MALIGPYLGTSLEEQETLLSIIKGKNSPGAWEGFSIPAPHAIACIEDLYRPEWWYKASFSSGADHAAEHTGDDPDITEDHIGDALAQGQKNLLPGFVKLFSKHFSEYSTLSVFDGHSHTQASHSHDLLPVSAWFLDSMAHFFDVSHKINLHKLTKLPESYVTFDEALFAYKLGRKRIHESLLAQCFDGVIQPRFVLTDHNVIDDRLFDSNNDKSFLSGCEFTVHTPRLRVLGEEIPKSTCHIVVYSLGKTQFEILQSKSNNIFDFVTEIRKLGLPHTLAHPLFYLHGRHPAHLLLFLVLFNQFEVWSGTGLASTNALVIHLLQGVTPHMLSFLENLFDFPAHGKYPWIKSGTSGEDCHSGMVAHQVSWTVVPQSTTADIHTGFENRLTFGVSNCFYGNFSKQVIPFFRVMLDHFMHCGFTFSEADGFNQLLTPHRTIPKKKLSWPRELLTVLIALVEASHHRADIFRGKYKKIRRLEKSLDKAVKLFQKGLLSKKHFFDQAYKYLITMLDFLIREIIAEIKKGKYKLALFSKRNLFASTIIGSHLSAINSLYSDRRLAGLVKQAVFRRKGSHKTLWVTDILDSSHMIGAMVREFMLSTVFNDAVNCVWAVCAKKHSSRSMRRVHHFSPVQTMPFGGDFLQCGVPSLDDVARYIVSENITCVVVSTPGPLGVVTTLVAKALHIPVIFFQHVDAADYLSSMYHSPLLSKLVRILQKEYLFRVADMALFGTRNSADEVFLPQERKRVVGRYVDLSQFNPSRRRENFFDELTTTILEKPFRSVTESQMSVFQKLRICTVIDLYNDIEIESLIASFNEFTSSVRSTGLLGPELHLIVTGRDLRDIEHGISDRQLPVFIHRELAPDAYKTAIASSDIFLWLAHSHIFPLPLAEAMACGVSCIGYKKSPADELLGNVGMLVDSQQQLHTALCMLATDAQLRISLGKRLYQVALSRLSEQAVVSNMAEAIRDVERMAQQGTNLDLYQSVNSLLAVEGVESEANNFS